MDEGMVMSFVALAGSLRAILDRDCQLCYAARMNGWKVTTRGRYALRAAIDLAANWGTEPVLRQDLSERQKISPDYVAKILQSLRGAGIAESVRGPGGGYRLTRDPMQITAGDVVRSVEGETAVVYCAHKPMNPSCPCAEGCSARGFWMELSERMDRYMDSVTLAELAHLDVGRQDG
jgi:Rrf2 family protein